MRSHITIAAGIVMASLFSVMFWSQVGAVASAVAQPKPELFQLKPAPYLRLQALEPVY